MHTNTNTEKTFKARPAMPQEPRKSRRELEQERGKQWKRTDKREHTLH